MSWNVSKIGTKAELLAVLPKMFDEAAAYYDYHDERREEYRDVVAAKESVLSLVASIDETNSLAEYPTIQVSSCGSRAAGWGGSVEIKVHRLP